MRARSDPPFAHPQRTGDMPIPLNDFWKLAINSRLLSADECQRLDAAFSRVRGAQQGNSVTLAEWLLASGVLSRYQTSVLLAGKAASLFVRRIQSLRPARKRTAQGTVSGRASAQRVFGGTLFPVERTGQRSAAQVAAVIRLAQAMAAFGEDHLSRVFEFVERKSAKFVVIEDLAGMTLADYLLSQPVAPADGCRIVRDLSLAASALHEHGQAHGDIRPQNIWLTAEGGVKLLGFPLGRDPAQSAAYRVGDAEPSARLSAQADYLAPELAFGGAAPDARADIYSLGCLAYALLIGRAPFAEGDVAQKLARHASEPAVTLDQFGMPPALPQLVAHMMAKNPPVRLDSATEVAAQLVPFASPDPTAGRPASPALEAFEQFLAQRPAAVAPSSAAAAPKAPVEVPAEMPVHTPLETPVEMSQPQMPISPAPRPGIAGGSGGLAVADRPTTIAQRAALADELVPVRPRVKRSKAKPRKVNPMALAAGVLALFAMAGVVAGLGVAPRGSGKQDRGQQGVPGRRSSAETQDQKDQETQPSRSGFGRRRRRRQQGIRGRRTGGDCHAGQTGEDWRPPARQAGLSGDRRRRLVDVGVSHGRLADQLAATCRRAPKPSSRPGHRPS